MLAPQASVAASHKGSLAQLGVAAENRHPGTYGLRTALGEDVITKLLAKNKEEAAGFAQNLLTAAQPFVVNPTAFVVDPAKTGRKWTHSEYGDFWNLMIAKKCRALYFNEGWQFPLLTCRG